MTAFSVRTHRSPVNEGSAEKEKSFHAAEVGGERKHLECLQVLSGDA